MRNLVQALIIGCLALVVFTGCGYKPTVHYAKKEIYGKIYVDLDVDIEDPKNSVLVKDAMNELLVHKLDGQLVYDKALADTVMDVKLNSVSLSELSYNEDGYIKLYKASTSINVQYENKLGKSNSFSVSGSYDFSIDDGGTISDTKRFEAIKSAANKALDEVLSKIAIQTFKKDETTSK